MVGVGGGLLLPLGTLATTALRRRSCIPTSSRLRCCSLPPQRRPIPVPPFSNSPNSSSLFFSCSSLSTHTNQTQNSFDSSHRVHQQSENGDNRRSVNGGGSAIWRVVLLGWLGAEEKQLKRYAQLYQSKGITPISFVVPVKEAFSFDRGLAVENRVNLLLQDLLSWCSQEQFDGRPRYLLFHSFSNTGWLAYGYILDVLQTRPDILDKIRGCVVDSGPAAEINAKVWAAGFTAALLKKGCSLTYSPVESIEASNPNTKGSLRTKDIKPSFLEIIVFHLLEMFFSIALMLPDINRKLTKVISVLSDKQPLCPQLYLYSSADKVIPAYFILSFIEKQKAMGRAVYSYDFVTSPHVDHLRKHPEIYSAKVDEFLKVCCSAIV